MSFSFILMSISAGFTFLITGLLVTILLTVRRVRNQSITNEQSEAIAAAINTQSQALSTGFIENRQEFMEQQRLLRGELSESNAKSGETIQGQLQGEANNQRQTLESFASQLHSLNRAVNENLAEMRRSSDERLTSLRDSFEKSGVDLRTTIDGKLNEIRTDNASKLEEMRATVDEKLQSTLDKRLGASFNLVNERLEAVHKGLGEMQQLANGVGDLKRVLTNVKTRGGWGEIQLGMVLQDMLAPNQYEENVAVIQSSNARVEYAIKIPREGGHSWLPIDSKFPREDYERIVEASEQADKLGLEKASKQLEITLKSFAKSIAEKYIKHPETENYAVMYLPTEGLFAEVARRPNLIDFIQREYRVVVTGPTTFSAVLTSLQLAFKTLAIQQRGDEVWKVLASTKTEFGKFGIIIDKVTKKINEAGTHLEQVSVRSRAIEKSLSGVETLEYESINPVKQVDKSSADFSGGNNA